MPLAAHFFFDRSIYSSDGILIIHLGSAYHSP